MSGRALSPAPDWFTLFTMSEQRERIRTLACELFLRDGADGFSMRKLARAVGVTAPALYKHYESKECLLHERVDVAPLGCPQHLDDAAEPHVLVAGEIRFAEHSLLGEGADRAEVAQRRHGVFGSIHDPRG